MRWTLLECAPNQTRPAGGGKSRLSDCPIVRPSPIAKKKKMVFNLYFSVMLWGETRGGTPPLRGGGDAKLISLYVPEARFNFVYECSRAQSRTHTPTLPHPTPRHDPWLSVALEAGAESPPAPISNSLRLNTSFLSCRRAAFASSDGKDRKSFWFVFAAKSTPVLLLP